jgi:hypothetical protein
MHIKMVNDAIDVCPITRPIHYMNLDKTVRGVNQMHQERSIMICEFKFIELKWVSLRTRKRIVMDLMYPVNMIIDKTLRGSPGYTRSRIRWLGGSISH